MRQMYLQIMKSKIKVMYVLAVAVVRYGGEATDADTGETTHPNTDQGLDRSILVWIDET